MQTCQRSTDPALFLLPAKCCAQRRLVRLFIRTTHLQQHTLRILGTPAGHSSGIAIQPLERKTKWGLDGKQGNHQHTGRNNHKLLGRLLGFEPSRRVSHMGDNILSRSTLLTATSILAWWTWLLSTADAYRDQAAYAL